MKNYAEYERTRFIENIDEANAKLNELETKRGLPRSEFESNIDRANQRVYELEFGATTPPPVVSQPSQPSQSQEIEALAKRRRELIACLGSEERFQGKCTTVEDYRADIQRLEGLFQERFQQTKTAPKEEPPKKHTPQTDAVAYFKSGKATGLAKAIGAATLNEASKK